MYDSFPVLSALRKSTDIRNHSPHFKFLYRPLLFSGIRNVPSSCRLHIIISKKTFRVILMLFSELKCKDVINLRNCQKLGKVSDLEFDECSGQIRKLFVPNGNKFLNFLCCEPDYCIPYKDIRQIGPDIIIVDIKC